MAFPVLPVLLSLVVARDVPLVTFDDATPVNFEASPTATWRVAEHIGILTKVMDAPGLKGPGFIKVVAEGAFPKLSSRDDLVLLLRSRTKQTLGLSLGTCSQEFQVPASEDFFEVVLPMHGDTEAGGLLCGERLELWADGPVEVKSIAARSGVGSAPPKEYNGCRHPVQQALRYNISSRKEPTVPVPVDPSETLADAVCCDKRTKVYAEPQFLYRDPDIALFKRLTGDVTTFYDSTCGVALFKAPVNRSLADFQADTDEHGWPSFRQEEVVSEHVTVDKDNFVYSSCGTHLGSYLPDTKGPRYCMDLSCIAGNPTEIMV